MDNDFDNRIEILENKVKDLKNQYNSIIYNVDLIKDLLLCNTPVFDGEKNFCPICGNVSVFKSFGAVPRKNVMCPTCFSLERHRMVYLLFKQRYFDLLTHNNIKLLHFAPEKMFYDFFRKHKNIDYYPVDISPQTYEPDIHIRKKVNMEQIPYDDCKFDFIYHCHVLEHVPNDIKAINELYRVLKDGGVCITLVPYFSDLNETLEKEEYNTPELRLKYYGQQDHLRKYGVDFKDRLESAGFNVELVTLADIASSEVDVDLFKLVDDTFFICTK